MINCDSTVDASNGCGVGLIFQDEFGEGNVVGARHMKHVEDACWQKQIYEIWGLGLGLRRSTGFRYQG